uniref:Uncharacterized protein n=1 Tax=Panagrolaimus sp. PS1159 TaxID=55785 RepID=A0AC35FCV7_9BILA
MFALAVYTILQLQYTFVVCGSRSKRISFQLYSAINDTQVTFPIICVSIGLFLANVFLDPAFILTAQEYFPFLHLIDESRSIKDLAFWNELQALTIPIFSLIIFAFLIRHALSINATGTYDKALSDCANSLKTYYETMKLPPEIRQSHRTKKIYNCIPKQPLQHLQEQQQQKQQPPKVTNSTLEQLNKKHKVDLNADGVAL